jgi:hypothetical protein
LLSLSQQQSEHNRTSREQIKIDASNLSRQSDVGEGAQISLRWSPSNATRQINEFLFLTQDPQNLPLCCRCGHVRGVAKEVAPYSGFRFICYCQDCQAFARFLDRPDVLDAAGGTDILHLPTGRVKLTAGRDAVRCLRFSSKVLRWYTDCCRTPVGNTAGPRFPIVGLIHSFMDHSPDGRSRDEVLGAALCRIFERSAVGPLPPCAPAPPSFGLFALRGSKLLGWWLHGLGRPNPFFDDQTNAPLSVPRVFTPDERATLTDKPLRVHPGP